MPEPHSSWSNAGDSGEHLIQAGRRAPGWYWILRPHHQGPGQYDPSMPVLSLIHISPTGALSSPLADLRDLDSEQLAPRDAAGVRYPSWFAGPTTPGGPSGTLRVVGPERRVEGEAPPVPGWYWCRTNPEAPLQHVDGEQIGPIYLDMLEGSIHVWSSATLHGRPIDVGELGFSEPLTSEGGIIDASGELGRNAVEFFGSIRVPPLPPSSPSWWTTQSVSPPALSLSDGEVILRVSNLDRARAFYEQLGMRIDNTSFDERSLSLRGGGVRLRLTTEEGPVLAFRCAPGISEVVDALNLGAQPAEHLVEAVDPDGHRIRLLDNDDDR